MLNEPKKRIILVGKISKGKVELRFPTAPRTVLTFPRSIFVKEPKR